jgi:hypothetical protein
MKATPTDYGKQRIPNIKRGDRTYAHSNKEKTHCLAETFFPLAQPTTANDHQFVEDHPPTAPTSTFPKFTAEQVLATLSKINPYKAPGPLGISNSILKQCADILAPLLANIYKAICNLCHYPEKFGNIHQIVLPKPG